MDASAYRHYRLRLLGLLLLWLAAAVAIVLFWQQLPLLAKGVALLVAVFVIPDAGTVKQAFSSYESYLREGLE